MQLVEYMSHARYTLGQITTGQQWQRLAGFMGALYAHDAYTILTLSSLVDEPPFLVLSPLMAAGLPCQDVDGERVDVVVPRVVRTAWSRKQCEQVTPVMIHDTSASVAHPVSIVSVLNTHGRVHHSVPCPRDSQVYLDPIHLEDGYRLAVLVNPQAHIKQHIEHTGIRSYTVTLDSESMRVIIPVETSGLDRVFPVKAAATACDRVDAPVWSTHSAVIEQWVMLPHPVDFPHSVPRQKTGLLTVQRSAHRVLPDDSGYETLLRQRMMSLFTLAGAWQITTGQNVDIAVAHTQMSVRDDAAVVSLLVALARIVTAHTSSSGHDADVVALMAALVAASILEIDTSGVARTVSQNTCDVEQLDMSRRVAVTVVSCLSPGLLGTGHGTSSWYPTNRPVIDSHPSHVLTPHVSLPERWSVHQGVMSLSLTGGLHE
ncbi:hypothetical protein QP849_06190 [Alloscardovia omnicolens]|uniref:hypothetical protein n=1 Tax=Alloscardovia omnicolens TaxID=419015 RepID=UPI00254D2058|nr:hypothetical protein [Alloscardovia omnicolens]MDK8649991.1 hypothetical protein [Alloscardovia omnicolens]